MEKKEAKTARLSAWVTPTIRELIRKKATSEGISESSIFSQALELFFKKEKKIKKST